MMSEILFCLIKIAKSEDGQMAFDFTSFLTVFQSYQDDGRVEIKVGSLERTRDR